MHAAGTHVRDVPLDQDAALGHDQAIGWHARQQVERRVERDAEVAQVAVVDADEWRLQPQRPIEFGAVVHFDQHVHAERVRRGLEFGHLRILERGDDEQDGVGAQRPRFGDLVGVDDEFLAQRRQRAGIARGDQIVRITLEERPVGQHRQARGTGALVACRDGRRVE